MIAFTVVLTNKGPNQATGVMVADVPPPVLSSISSNTSQGSFSGTIWNVGTLDAQSWATLILTGTAQSVGIFTNIAQVSASDQTDPNSTNDLDEAAFTVVLSASPPTVPFLYLQ